MENITFYQKCIKHLLSEYERLGTDETEVKLSFDDERMCYIVMRVGWFQKYKRIHRCLVHIEICGDSVLIQANNTEDPIDTDLIEMGIPKEKIRLGFIPDDFRTYAEQHSPREKCPEDRSKTPSRSPIKKSRTSDEQMLIRS